MKKVYLAKSNRSNPNLVMKVRELLFQYDIEIVEFTGGEYSSKPLLSCDYLIIVPELPVDNLVIDVDNVIIGKGLFTQIREFYAFNESSYFNNIIVISDDNLQIKTIDNLKILDISNYIETANLHFDEDSCDMLEEFCIDNYPIKLHKYNTPNLKSPDLISTKIEQTNKTITSYIYAVAKIAQNNVKKT